MDIQKLRQEFEELPDIKGILHGSDFDFNESLNQYYHPDHTNHRLNYAFLMGAWMVWQAAKAQAVPEWISTSERMPEEGEEVFVHSLGQVRQATRDSSFAGGFKERNCYGWQATYSQSHWMPKSIKLPEQYHFYYEFEVLMSDSKQKAMIKAQEQDQ